MMENQYWFLEWPLQTFWGFTQNLHPTGTRRPQYLDWSRIAFFLREDAIPELRARLDSRGTATSRDLTLSGEEYLQ